MVREGPFASAHAHFDPVLHAWPRAPAISIAVTIQLPLLVRAGTMEAVQAAWAMPLKKETCVPMQDETLEETVTALVAWATAEAAHLQQFQQVLQGYNVFASPACQSLFEGKGRPDLPSVIAVPGLAHTVLSMPLTCKWQQFHALLEKAHAKKPLRLPAQADDLYWLTFTAKRLVVMRAKLLFMKSYPNRMIYRLGYLSSKDLATIADLLMRMQTIEVKEPAANTERPLDMGDLFSDPASPLRPSAVVGDSQTTSPATPALTPSPLPKAEPSKDRFGIPLMFAPTLDIEESPQKRPRVSEAIPGMFAVNLPPRPIHKGAVKQHFQKPEAPASKTVKAPGVKAPRAKAPPMPKVAAKAPAVKVPLADGEVQVKYTYPNEPVRTYCQAFVDGKWQHVVTVTWAQHPKHRDIVLHIGGEVHKGKKTLEEAKAERAKLLSTWPR